jgi:LysR family glycine cleavage system transcriptional activator
MRDLPLNALRAFAAVYETGGVRTASRALGVSHSAISRHLRELEAWIGQPLVESRIGTRALAFTPQGEALGRAGLASLRTLERATAALREARRGNAVTIATTPSFAARWLLPRLAAFEAAHRWIELSVVSEQRLLEPAQHGADFAIRMGRGPWPGLACEPFMDDALYPVMSRGLWETCGRPRAPCELAGLRLLHDRDPNASWSAWQAAYPVEGLDVRKGPRYASSDLVLRAAAQGLGAALARDRLAADDVASGALLRPFGAKRVELPDAYWIVQPQAPPGRSATTAVIDWLKQEGRNTPPNAGPSRQALKPSRSRSARRQAGP